MRLRRLTFLFLPAAAALVAVLPLHAATTPAIQAKQAEAARVMHEIDAIDERLSVVTERYDGARVHLADVKARLRVERRSLARARVEYRRAQLRVARLLVTLYESDRPTALEAIVGSRSVSEALAVIDAESRIAREDDAVSTAAMVARDRLRERVRAVAADRAAAARAVTRIARERTTIERGLAQRRALLATVQAQLSRLEAAERARQARLAAIARARLAAEAKAREQALAAAAARAAKARADAAARARVQAAAKPAAAPDPAPAPTTTTPAAAPAAPAPVTLAAPTTLPAPTPAPTVVPSGPLPAGHPEAASIAVQEIGVPYRWGGADPTGFDCSGLVAWTYAQLGITLPHYAAAQWTLGTAVAEAELQPGDLVFFDGLAHVGIYIGGGQFVHAPHTGTFVRIESLGDPWYSSRYVGARRI